MKNKSAQSSNAPPMKFFDICFTSFICMFDHAAFYIIFTAACMCYWQDAFWGAKQNHP
jgi:hypothetical protein